MTGSATHSRVVSSLPASKFDHGRGIVLDEQVAVGTLEGWAVWEDGTITPIFTSGSAAGTVLPGTSWWLLGAGAHLVGSEVAAVLPVTPRRVRVKEWMSPDDDGEADLVGAMVMVDGTIHSLVLAGSTVEVVIAEYGVQDVEP